MKKFYYSLFAAVSMMLAVTSCSQEEDFVQSSSEMTTFSISLDEAAGSRATSDPVIGDGTKVNQLHYVVYNSENSTVVIDKAVKTFSNKTVQLELPLMKSEKYDILFWAQASEAGIYDATDLRNIKINYTNATANNEKYDAFFNALNDFTADGGKHKVVLRRPFAQLNVATTVHDWTEATEKYNKNNGTTGKAPVTKSKVVVSKLASTFDVLTGKADGATSTEVIFTADKIEELLKDANNISIKRDGTTTSYKLLAMNYLLPLASQGPDGLKDHTPVGTDAKDVVEVEFTLYKGENGDQEIASVKVPSTPIQRNYRTNIIGDLLTGEEFDIVIDEIFDKPDHDEYIDIKADGIVKKADGYYITNKNGFEAFANLVNYGSSQASRSASTGYTFEGMTFVLDCDIDLAGAEWTPIGSNGAMFSGTFDGNGKTVSNFKVDVKENGGLFGNVQKSTIKDLKVQTANIKSTHYAGGIAAHGVCAEITGCTVEDITITVNPNVKIGNDYNGDKAGGIIGYLCADGGDASLINCKANKVTITAYRDFGGIVGYTGKSEGYTKNPTVSENSVGSEENSIVLVIDNSNNYKEYTQLSQYNVGEIIGRNNGATGENTTPADKAVQIVFTGADQYPGYYQDAEGNYIATEDLGITNLIKEGVTDINLADGSFKMPNVLAGKTLTFAGSRNAELDLTPVQDSQNTGANLTFSGITVKYGTQIYKGLKHTNSVTYNDCAINGLQFLYAPTTFTNCDLNSNGAEHCVWTYGADEVSFTNCTFTYGDRAVNCYSDQSGQATKATFTDCTFTKVAGKPTSGAIETNSSKMVGLELNINNCKVNEGDLWWISSYDELNGANTVVTVDGTTILGYDNEGNRIVYVSSDKELDTAINNASKKTDVKTILTLATGTYSENINLTVATKTQTGDLVFKAAEGATPVIAGTVTLGYRNQGVGAAMWNGNVTFEGITFDHANAATHSLDVQDVKSLTLKNCKIVGDGEYGIGCARGNASTGSITGCTFENAGMQLLGNFATGLVIDGCTFNESRINVQAGNGVTVQNCNFTNTLTSANVSDSFYLIRSNSTPITVKSCNINIDSNLQEIVTEKQEKWYILANRGTTNWTVEGVAVTMSAEALKQTELFVTKCTSTGVINTKNLTVNGKDYASTAAQLTAAVNNGATDIYVQGEFKMPSNSTSKTITISSLNGNATIDNTLGSYWENATLTFNNVKFKTSTGKANGNGSDYAALYSKNVTYNKCSFSGPMRLGRDGAKFIECTFNDLGNDYVWTYGNAATFEDCTFNSAGKALLIYSDGGNGAPAVSVTGCTFNATQGAKAGAISNQNCAAIEIHNYGYGVTLTTSGNTVETENAKFSGEWRIKTYETRNANSKIFVNGKEYTTLALDGKTMTIDDGKNVTVKP